VSRRDFDDPRYKAARAAARKRDGYACLMCHARKGLVAHHISRWADSPSLRFDPRNIATICRPCHKKVTGNEGAYAPLLLSLIAKRTKRT
jgi:5-methylcytosine-specific restriction endonuclease McrA